ncbi:MAG: hypothetical protein HKN82_08200 [Akkermansiaceae bacterium]|nr:hypothetical protein [Akkermansiaceae bacterium]NNM31261.1 hypothetical protein [Akkermansiaceae bacterium]
MGDEFFIGWQGKAPEKTGKFLKRLTIAGLAAVLGLAVALPALQDTVSDDASFDFGNLRLFEGILVAEPVPMLVSDAGVVYYLVHPFKHGFDAEVAKRMHLLRVQMMGTRIWRSDQEMIEVEPGTVIGAGDQAAHPLGTGSDLGEVTLRGEIVDAKCYLGVMNPGNLKPHRACAINCIQGGIPPVLLVRDSAGRASYFLLVGAGGEALNGRILPMVAAPVAVTGRLKKLGKQRILYCDPAGIVLE